MIRKIRFWYKIQLSRVTRLLTKVITSTDHSKKRNRAISRRTQIILDPVHKGWVIEKLAKKIVEYYPGLSKPKLTYVPLRNTEITHWMHYLNVSPAFLKNSTGLNTFLVPHVDSREKQEYLAQLIDLGGIPIFMSEQHAQEVSTALLLPEVAAVILPGSDAAGTQSRLRIVISSNYYPDGRKNEHYLKNLAKDFRLDSFHFTFIGKSWEVVGRELIQSGAEVEYLDPSKGNYLDYKTQLNLIRGFDLFVYLGFDEGSLGALDAYLLGVPLLVTRQGFHLQFGNKSDIRFFTTYDEFRRQLMESKKRFRPSAQDTEKWTWYSYASSYRDLWESLLVKRERE